MADKVKLKDETVKLLRATLVPSQKTGLSVRQCEQEYKGLTGSVLPFRQLGYSTAEDMFSDWHDVVRISYEQGQMVIRARETEETEHLHRMVERQNMSGKDKKVLQRRRYGAHDHYSRPTHPLMRSSHHSSMPPRSHSLQQSRYRSAHYQHPTHTDSYSQRQMPSSHSNSLAPHQTRRTATQIVRGKVKELLMSYPTGLIGSSFEKAFVRRFGQSIQCRAYGFSNFLEMMRAMNDFVSIEDLSSGGYKLHSKANYRKIQEPTHNYSSHGQGEDKFGSQENLNTYSDEEISNNSKLRGGDIISEELKLLVKKTLYKKPEGIWAARFGTEFRSSTGTDLPVKQLGFLSVIEFISSPELSEVVKIKRPTERDWLIFDATAEGVEDEPSQATAPMTNTSPPIPDIFKEKLHHVLCSKPQGVLMDNLSETYWDVIGEELQHRKLGFATLEALILELTDVASLYYAGEGSAQLYLRPVVKEEPSDVPIYRQLAGDKSRHAETIHIEIPPDAVGPGVAYVQVSLPLNQIGNYVEVYVSNVITPRTVWLQLRGVRTTESLELLMDQLEYVYESKEGDNYRMPDSLVVVGQICVAVFPEDSNWHRVTITGIRDNSFVDVFYVDYGSSCAVPRSQLRLLRNRFCKLPAQAIRGTLANITACGTDWTRSARNSLLQMCSSKPLIALISDISQERVLSVCLCDTTGAEDVHINDILVQQGHARFLDSYEGGSVKSERSKTPDPSPTLSPSSTTSSISDIKAKLSRESSIMVADLEKEMIDDAVSPSKNYVPPAPETEESNICRHIKFVQLTTEHSMHVICVKGKGYAVSGEVSAFIWERDLLRTMLRLKYKMPKLVVSQEDFPEIFEEFVQQDVKGTMTGDAVKQCVTLYELADVCKILDIFKHESEELKRAVKYQADTFNASDPYWLGKSTESVEETNHDLTMLRQKLTNMQTRRKELLRLVRDVNSAEESQRYVEELASVEDRLVRTRHELDYAVSHQEELSSAPEGLDIRPSFSDRKSLNQKNMGEATKFFNPSANQSKTNFVAPMPSQVAENDMQSFLNMAATTSASRLAEQQMAINQQLYAQNLMNMSAATTMGCMPNVSCPMPGNPALMKMMADLSLGGSVTTPQTDTRATTDLPQMTSALNPEQMQLLANYQMILRQAGTIPPTSSHNTNIPVAGGLLGNPMLSTAHMPQSTPMNTPLANVFANPGLTGGLDASMFGGMLGMPGMPLPGMDRNVNLLLGQGRGRVNHTTSTPGGLQNMTPQQQ